MKLIKIHFKIIAMPLIAFIWLICFAAKTAANISCYILGPIMFITFGIIIWMAIAQNWLSCIGFLVVEATCALLLFGSTWMIANMQDINRLLIRFVQP
jgi:NADH-quinone oxidoreductase subunit A